MAPSCPPCPNQTCESYGKSDDVIRNGLYRKKKQDKQKRQRYLCKSCGKTFVPEPLPERRSHRPEGKGEKGKAAYDEKKDNRTLSLTSEAYAGLEELALRRGLSRSELVERIGRGLIRLSEVLSDLPNELRVSELPSESLLESPSESPLGEPTDGLSESTDELLSESPMKGKSEAPSKSLPESLMHVEMARRLDIPKSTLSDAKKRPNFPQWSKEHDPDQIAWTWDARAKVFVPVADVPSG